MSYLLLGNKTRTMYHNCIKHYPSIIHPTSIILAVAINLFVQNALFKFIDLLKPLLFPPPVPFVCKKIMVSFMNLLHGVKSFK